jgi:hypothetical protein
VLSAPRSVCDSISGHINPGAELVDNEIQKRRAGLLMRRVAVYFGLQRACVCIESVRQTVNKKRVNHAGCHCGRQLSMLFTYTHSHRLRHFLLICSPFIQHNTRARDSIEATHTQRRTRHIFAPRMLHMAAGHNSPPLTQQFLRLFGPFYI